jgi:hypothetical protein
LERRGLSSPLYFLILTVCSSSGILQNLHLPGNRRILYIIHPCLVKGFYPIFHIFGHFFTTVGVGLIPAGIVPTEIASAEFVSLAKTEGGRLLATAEGVSLPAHIFYCYCEHLKGAWQSHNSSYRSRHSLFVLLINRTFFCLEPAFICFSLKMAFSMSSKTS